MEPWEALRAEAVDRLIMEYHDATEDEKTLRAEYEEVCDARAVAAWRLRESGLTGVQLTKLLGISAARVSSLTLRGREVLQRRREAAEGE